MDSKPEPTKMTTHSLIYSVGELVQQMKTNLRLSESAAVKIAQISLDYELARRSIAAQQEAPEQPSE